MGDRAYATARGVYAVRQAGAHVRVRFNPVNLRTCDRHRQGIYLKQGDSRGRSRARHQP